MLRDTTSDKTIAVTNLSSLSRLRLAFGRVTLSVRDGAVGSERLLPRLLVDGADGSVRPRRVSLTVSTERVGHE